MFSCTLFVFDAAVQQAHNLFRRYRLRVHQLVVSIQTDLEVLGCSLRFPYQRSADFICSLYFFFPSNLYTSQPSISFKEAAGPLELDLVTRCAIELACLRVLTSQVAELTLELVQFRLFAAPKVVSLRSKQSCPRARRCDLVGLFGKIHVEQ